MNHITQLKSVVALAKHRHFGRAADSIGLTQSALSQNIQKLEQSYGVPLFERKNRQVSLTTYGEIVRNSAITALESIANAQREIGLLQNLETGHLMLGVDPYLASSILAPALAELLSSHPRLRFTARDVGWDQIEDKLLSDELDVYFGIAPQSIHRDLHIETIVLPTPLLLCRPDHELATQEIVSLTQSMGLQVVTSAPPAWYIKWAQQQVDELQDKFDVTNLIFLEADNIGLVKQVARQAYTLTAALPSDAETEISNGDLVVIKLENWPLEMEGCIVTKANRTLPPAAELLIEYYKKAVDSEFDKASTLPASGDKDSPIVTLT